jgi:hypothetical protein
MALYLNQNETRSQLSGKVAATLNQRLTKRSIDNAKQPDVILQNQRKTTGGGLFWSAIIAVVVVAAVIYLLFFY